MNDTRFADRYRAGIARAAEGGLITHSGAGEDDDHAHLSSTGPLTLRYTNSRGLTDRARIALARTPDAARILELGPGVGVALATISRLRPGARIDTLALTPIDPWQRLRFDGIFAYLEAGTPHAVLFEDMNLPFVRHQWIGTLDTTLDLIDGPYDLIFDCLGPVFYNFNEKSPTYDRVPPPRLVEGLVRLLARGGQLIVEAPDRHGQLATALRQVGGPTDLVWTGESTVDLACPPCGLERFGTGLN